MFTFSDENSPYPQQSYHQTSSFHIQEYNIFPQQSLLYGPYNCLPPLLNSPILENSIKTNLMTPNLTNNLSLEPQIDLKTTLAYYPSNIISNVSSKRAVASTKKDRHTKIRTAQGVRDRRVRLSISIAREFFSLQDMLGFDKASKTLGWLLGKSRAAIDELTMISKINCKNDEVKIVCANDEEEEEGEKPRILSGSKIKREREENTSCVRRAKARERARERTKNKKMIIDLNNHHLNQRVQHNLLIGKSNPVNLSQDKEISAGESVVIKTNLRGSCHNYNNETMSSKGYQENYNANLTKLALDNCGSLRQQGFPALNIINLSTEIHINAKPWETFSNQVLP